MAVNLNVNPLSEDHLRQINEALEAAEVARMQIEMAERAQIDVTEQKRRLQQYVEQLRAIKQVYFPGR